MKSTESVLGLIGVDSSSISAAEPRALLERMDRPLLLLLDLSICSRARSRADCLLGRAPIKTGISSIDRDRSIVVKSLCVKLENAKDINETQPIGASIDKTRSKLETTRQMEPSQFNQLFLLYNPTVTRSDSGFRLLSLARFDLLVS